MASEIKYEFEDDEIIIREVDNRIYLCEYNNDSELEFRFEDADNVISLLENIEKCIKTKRYNYVDLGTYESEDENGDSTGEYYWNEDFIMDNPDINPYFSPDDDFYGNCIYRNDISNILKALREYINPSSTDRLDRLTLKSILRLKRNLANEN